MKPGKVAWDWWNDWNLYGVDFKTGVNNDTYKYYIDFAAEHGIEYVIFDEGWTKLYTADLMQVSTGDRHADARGTMPHRKTSASSSGPDTML